MPVSPNYTRGPAAFTGNCPRCRKPYDRAHFNEHKRTVGQVCKSCLEVLHNESDPRVRLQRMQEKTVNRIAFLKTKLERIPNTTKTKNKLRKAVQSESASFSRQLIRLQQRIELLNQQDLLFAKLRLEAEQAEQEAIQPLAVITPPGESACRSPEKDFNARSHPSGPCVYVQ
jgi:hypothetical protein